MLPGYLAAVPTTTEIDQALLNIKSKERSNLFPWNGQFSPQLVEVLLKRYAPKTGVVLDPFGGSGTVLHECGRERYSAIACEINPAAFTFARLYELINVPKVDRDQLLRDVEGELAHLALEKILPFERMTERPSTGRFDTLLTLRNRLSGWRQALMDALILMVGSKPTGIAAIHPAWQRLKSTIDAFPYSKLPVRAFNCDARSVPLPDDAVDFVVTSPPYINVFNYHQQYRGSTESLGWDLLTVAKSEIGSNRKHRGNRFLTVIQYCLDITSVLLELNRVCKPSARAIFVVGRESSVRGCRFFNGEIVARLAAECTSFRLDLRQERVFKNRFGQDITEDLLHFHCRKTSKHGDLFNLYDARAVARRFLLAALKQAGSDDVRNDIQNAVASLQEVQPSSLYLADKSYRQAEQSYATMRRSYKPHTASDAKFAAAGIQYEQS